jgi:fucose permease
MVAALIIFIYGMLASMLGTLVPALGTRLALDTASLSYLALAQGIGLAATSVWAGALMDRRGTKIGILAGLVASLFGLGLLSRADSLAMGLGAMALLGVGGSLVIVGANAVVNDVSDTNKASALNILNLFVGLGGMATPFVAGNLLHSDPTLVAYFGLATCLVALITMLIWRAPVVVHGEEAPIDDKGLFASPALYLLAAVTFSYTACEFSMWNWLPKYMIASGVPEVTALNILSFGFAGGLLLGRLAAAPALSRLSPVPVVLSCALAMCVSTFAVLQVNNASAFGIAAFVTGLIMAPVFPTTIAVIGNNFPRQSATAIGFAITCGFSGLVVSSPIIGMLASSNGLGRALLLMPVLSAVIVLILLVSFRKLTSEAQAQVTSADPIDHSPASGAVTRS